MVGLAGVAGGGRLADGEAFGVGGSVGWRPKDVVAGGGYEEHTVFRRGAAPEKIRTVRTAGSNGAFGEYLVYGV